MCMATTMSITGFKHGSFWGPGVALRGWRSVRALQGGSFCGTGLVPVLTQAPGLGSDLLLLALLTWDPKPCAVVTEL